MIDEPRWYRVSHEIVANPGSGERCLLLHRTSVVLSDEAGTENRRRATCPNRQIRSNVRSVVVEFYMTVVLIKHCIECT